MQLSLGLSQIGHTIKGVGYDTTLSSGSTELSRFNQPKESRAYAKLSGCVLEHIITTTQLSHLEKLFYILVNALSVINRYGTNQRVIALSAESWAERLNCAKSQVFVMQKSLESKGYFVVVKDRNRHGQNKRNLIHLSLPDTVFYSLCKTADSRVGQSDISLFYDAREPKLEYLDRTKLFIVLGYQVLKDIAACGFLTPFHKVIWLDFYTICYKRHLATLKPRPNVDDSIDADDSFGDLLDDNRGFQFITTYKQLEERYSCNKSLLSRALRDLEVLGLIKREHFYTRKERGNQERRDKSLWIISLLSPELPSDRFSSDGLGNDGNSSRNNNKGHNSFGFDTSHNCIASSNLNSYNVETRAEMSKEHENTEELEEATLGCEPPDLPDSSFEASTLNTDTSNISYNDPDVAGNSLHNIILFNKNNLKSNIEENSTQNSTHQNKKSKLTQSLIINSSTSNVEIHKNNKETLLNPLNTNSLTNNASPHKNGHQDVQSGDDQAKTENKEVFRGIKFFKGKPRDKHKFSICDSLIRKKLKLISRDKADKARKFAYALFSKKLTKSYSTSLTRHELAKQFIYHTATWRPTKIDESASLTEDQQIDVALTVAWEAVVKGTWQEPLEWSKAKALEYEYLAYKKKYAESGIISNELPSLEQAVNTLLGGGYSLASIITKEVDEAVDAMVDKVVNETDIAADKEIIKKADEGMTEGTGVKVKNKNGEKKQKKEQEKKGTETGIPADKPGYSVHNILTSANVRFADEKNWPIGVIRVKNHHKGTCELPPPELAVSLPYCHYAQVQQPLCVLKYTISINNATYTYDNSASQKKVNSRLIDDNNNILEKNHLSKSSNATSSYDNAYGDAHDDNDESINAEPISRDFIKIDNAIINILKNLKQNLN